MQTTRRCAMRCAYCASLDNKVVDSRINDLGNSIRRRRECLKCGKRFTSYETVELVPVLVVKRDGARESFNPQKVKSGIVKACEKRPVTAEQINDIVDRVEKSLSNFMEQEVTSQHLGDIIMDELKGTDPVAYVRFAAVYRQFQDISSFLDFIKTIESNLSATKAS